MININGKKTVFEELTLDKHLIYHDGPLLSIMANKNDDLFFVCWCDNNETSNRWMKYSVSKENCDLYINKEITLLSLMKKQKTVTFFEIEGDDADFTPLNIVNVKFEDVPEIYLPTKDSFYFN